MFGTKKKQRSALPEKQQLTKYYEMDGALRAYANRMALLGMTCGVFALGTLGLFAYVRLQPPVVIRVDNSGEATVVGGDTVKVGANGLMGLLKVSASGPENSPGEVEGRAVVRKFLTSYLTYTPANVERQYADALNMMTLNFRQLTMNKFREDDILGKVKTDAITSSIKIRSIEPATGHAVDLSGVCREGGPPPQPAAHRVHGKDGVPVSGAAGLHGPLGASIRRASMWANSGSNRWWVKRTSI